MDDAVVKLLQAKTGHFELESGHHGHLWLDLEPLFLRPTQLRPFIVELGRRLSAYEFDTVCGPLVGGAFVSQIIAAELDSEFYFTEEIKDQPRNGLFPVEYRLPASLRGRVRGKRVAIVNDVINAGSAVRGTFADLEACGAKTVAIGSLVVLGSAADGFAGEKEIPLEYLNSLANQLWTPSECPLCATGVPLNE